MPFRLYPLVAKQRAKNIIAEKIRNMPFHFAKLEKNSDLNHLSVLQPYFKTIITTHVAINDRSP